MSDVSKAQLEGLIILPELVGRSGPIGMIGIVNQTTSVGAFVSSYLRCDIGNGAGDDPPMLFAIPLDFGPNIRQIPPGVSVLDLFIQGFDYGRSSTAAYRRNFEYIFAMVRLRGLEFGSKIDEQEQSDFFERATLLLQCIIDLPDNDKIKTPEVFSTLDKFFHYSVRTKLLSGSGQFVRQRISLSALDASQWLANYLNGNERVLLESVHEAFEAFKKGVS